MDWLISVYHVNQYYNIVVFGIKPSECCESAAQLQVLKSLTAGCCSLHNASTALPAKIQKPAVLQVSADLCHSGAVDLNFDLTCLDPQKLISLDSWKSLTMPILNSTSSFARPIGLLDLVSLLLANIHRILSHQLLCPGTRTRLHWECSNCFFHLDVSTTSFLKVAARVIQSGGVCDGETSLVWAFVDEALKREISMGLGN